MGETSMPDAMTRSWRGRVARRRRPSDPDRAPAPAVELEPAGDGDPDLQRRPRLAPRRVRDLVERHQAVGRQLLEQAPAIGVDHPAEAEMVAPERQQFG